MSVSIDREASGLDQAMAGFERVADRPPATEWGSWLTPDMRAP